MKSIIAKDLGITFAENFEHVISTGSDFLYVAMGKPGQWPDGDTLVTPYDTTYDKNLAFKNGIVMKRVTGSDIQPVVPRVDWTTGTPYVAYDQTANLFSKTYETALADVLLNVDSVVLPNTVYANTDGDLSGLIQQGSVLRISTESREVAYVNTAGDYLVVNTNFTIEHIDEIGYRTFSAAETWQYYNQFYVRNIYDQVFKCLHAPTNTDSTTMPEITLGGQLPENPYIQTADGYKWKYLYTIPSGLKKKFFTEKYMPVIRDTTVYNNTVDGRIDIVQVIDGGSGYFNGSTVSNYPIAAIAGDGTGATATVDVASGVITEVNITEGGSGYTLGSVTITDPLQLNSGNTANLRVVISPQYGHGSDPVRELGASYEMISVDFAGDMEGLLPTSASDEFRQIFLVRNPRISANTDQATAAQYLMCTKLFVENRAVFTLGSEVFIGDTYETAIFTATCVFYDSSSGILYVNNIVGDVDNTIGREIYQRDNILNYAQVFSVTKPSINTLSGEILYIENRDAVTRSVDQTETAKIVIEF